MPKFLLTLNFLNFSILKKFDPSDLISPLLAENKLMHEPGKNAICTDKIW